MEGNRRNFPFTFFSFSQHGSSSFHGCRRGRVLGRGRHAIPGLLLHGRRCSPCRIRCPCCCCTSVLRGAVQTATAAAPLASGSAAAPWPPASQAAARGLGPRFLAFALWSQAHPHRPSPTAPALRPAVLPPPCRQAT
jgi:hypothetical protein